MHRLPVILLLAGILAACAPLPPPRPFVSPLPFDSPLPRGTTAGTRVYLPLTAGAPSKVGVSMAQQFRDCAHVSAVGAVWQYDWTPQPLQCPGIEGVPMVWCPGDGILNSPLPSEHLLLFNECDRNDQCNCLPEKTARAWREWEGRCPDCKLIGPNISETGMPWLLAWHEAYIRLYGEQPRIWALGVHCYSGLASCQRWVDINVALAQEWTASGQVWVTEWALGCWGVPTPEAEAFMAWLLAHPGVERAAWFLAYSDGTTSGTSSCETSLVNATGCLTPLGVGYRAVAVPE